MAADCRLLIEFDTPVTEKGNVPIVAEVFDGAFARVWHGTVRLLESRMVNLQTSGPYLVRAWLPNGELVTQSGVATDGETTAVRLAPQDSPHRSLGWARYTQTREGHDLDEGRPETAVRFQYHLDDPFSPTHTVRVRAHAFQKGVLSPRAPRIEIDRSLNRDGSIPISRGRPARVRVATESGQSWLEVHGQLTGILANDFPQLFSADSFSVALPTINESEVEVLLEYDAASNLRD